MSITKVSVVNVTETEKKEASAEQLPATKTPKTTRSEIGCDLSLSSSNLTTSRQNDGSASYSVETGRGKLIDRRRRRSVCEHLYTPWSAPGQRIVLHITPCNP
ncbi:hypothetical protein VZT92_012635 [Zoarces viviparus]